MIKFVVTRITKLLSSRLLSSRLLSSQRSAQGAVAVEGRTVGGTKSRRVDAPDVTRLIGHTPSHQASGPETGFFDHDDPNDRLAWPARDCAAKPRDTHTTAIDDAVMHRAPLAPVMRSLDDVTRLVRPARPSAVPADRTVLLKAEAFAVRPVADATRIITPRNRH